MLVGDYSKVPQTWISCSTVFPSPKMCVRQGTSLWCVFCPKICLRCTQVAIVPCGPFTKQCSLKAWNKLSTLFMVIFVATFMRSPLHFFFKHTTQHHSIDWKRLIYTFTAANTLAQLFIPFWCSNLIRGYALHFRLNTHNTVLAFPWKIKCQFTNSGFITFFNLRQTFESVRSVYCVATNIEYLSW